MFCGLWCDFRDVFQLHTKKVVNHINLAPGSAAASLVADSLLLRGGPCVVVDTACTSGLVAFSVAAEALERGSCQDAIVASANVILSVSIFNQFDRALSAGNGRSLHALPQSRRKKKMQTPFFDVFFFFTP